ncbi:hypothetical protein A2763_03610 [Candidatus Kaiserbacteria bacterium RIFCSPHIGHO2_01_FULL_54_36]|uniref:Uncharacterized protein n=1 Tax=Candidatus Kaiserbacteria bacterium RIFCSPHIGHO2_01_FULL_54_36 TaxID=1798482 RepID=A0A1F6CLB5_9BACT|nr:MAG: hypothetical protein A2763_03610 [Candidatus Kaiserbacteria bacterium RIFCSPHIGHO2_01_FULL_54_36]OGG75447.1 MAG: hypothetical protein A3A41_00290 [Candidatus Kaiserbacteria bacterium RIFCSPLOWO2_01_FULL_54_22]
MHAPGIQAHGSAALLAAARRLYFAFHIRFSASLHAKTKNHFSDNARGASALGPYSRPRANRAVSKSR